MRRWQIWIILFALILCCILAMNGKVLEPENYIGKWYSCADGTPYLFHNGIVICEQYHVKLDDAEIYSGAYSFGKERILLFYLNADGVGHVRELQLHTNAQGDLLCEQSPNGPIPVFQRSKLQ